MIETLANVDLPRRWAPPESEGEIVKLWPLMAALMNKDPDELTKGIIMGLKGVLDYIQLATDLEIKDITLPESETLAEVLKNEGTMIPALLDQFEHLEIRKKESNTAYTKGLFIGFAVWYVTITEIDEQPEEEDIDTTYEQPAYSMEEDEESEVAVEAMSADIPKLKKVAGPTKVRDLIIKFKEEFEVSSEIVFENDSFVLITKIPQYKLCHDLLRYLEIAFSSDNQDTYRGVIQYVVSDGLITAAVKIPEEMEW